jgi:hypothetical protein
MMIPALTQVEPVTNAQPEIPVTAVPTVVTVPVQFPALVPRIVTLLML